MGEEKGRRLRGVEEAGEPGNLFYSIYYLFLQSQADTNYGYMYVNIA